jgi:hypothetical protein
VARAPADAATTNRKSKSKIMKTISLILAMFLTVAFSGPAAEAGRIPFNGTLEASETVQIFGDPPLFSVLGSGTATSTQLGQFTLLYTFIALNSQPKTTGASNFIAANGVDIIYTYISSGLATPTADPDVVSIVEMHTITGGTGRYANAKGSFTVNRLSNVVTGATTGSFNGTIKLKKH